MSGRVDCVVIEHPPHDPKSLAWCETHHQWAQVCTPFRLQKVAEEMAVALREAEETVRGGLPHQIVRNALMTWERFVRETTVETETEEYAPEGWEKVAGVLYTALRTYSRALPETYDTWWSGHAKPAMDVYWEARLNPDTTPIPDPIPDPIPLVCGFCGQAPELHGDSDQGPMSVCPEPGVSDV